MTEHIRNALAGYRRGPRADAHLSAQEWTRSRQKIVPRPDAYVTVVTKKCTWCDDLGHFSYGADVGEPNFGETFQCPFCNSGNDPATLHRLSGLNAHEQQWRLTDLDTQGRPSIARLEAECSELVKGHKRMLTIWGSYGIGKTLSLQLVVNEVIERRIPAMYYTTKKMLDHLREPFGAPPGDRRDALQARLQRLEQVPYLALDEFDKVSQSEWVIEQLTDLIDRRHRGSEAGTHATLIAMNTDPAQLEPWIASRLFAGNNRIVHVEGADLRPLLSPDADAMPVESAR